jgi:hypothetical protein
MAMQASLSAIRADEQAVRIVILVRMVCQYEARYLFSHGADVPGTTQIHLIRDTIRDDIVSITASSVNAPLLGLFGKHFEPILPEIPYVAPYSLSSPAGHASVFKTFSSDLQHHSLLRVSPFQF